MCTSTSTCTLHVSSDPDGPCPNTGGYIQLESDPYEGEDGKRGGGDGNGAGGGKDGDSKAGSKDQDACSKLRRCSLS